MIISN